MESEAPPSAAFYNFLGWLNANKKPLGWFVLAVAAVIGFLVFRDWKKDQNEIAAAEQLSNIRLPYNAGELPPPGTDDALVKLAAEHSGTSAGAHAQLLAGSTFFAEGKYAEAQAQFEKFLGEHGDSPWAVSAKYGLATSLDAQNKTNEAIAKYEEFIKRYPNDPVTDHAKLGAGRLYEQSGKPEQAVEIYDKMLKSTMNNPNSYNQTAMDAQERLKELFTKNPALAPPKIQTFKTNTTLINPVNPLQSPQTNLAAVKAIQTNLLPVVKTNLFGKP